MCDRVRQSHFHVRGNFRTLRNMGSDEIVAALKRLGVSHDEIAEVIGKDRTAATKMLGGKRNVQVKELVPLQNLIAKYEQEAGEVEPIERSLYEEVEVLPTFAGMGGGGTGEGDRRVALISRALIRDELRAKPSDLLLIEVRGTSMQPLFEHGDQLLIDKRDRNPIQPGPFALFDGDAYLVKLVERAPGRRGWYRIWSANPEFSEDFVEETETTIMGRPVWFARRL